MTDYNVYTLSWQEVVIAILMSGSVLLLFGLIFFKLHPFSLVLLGLTCWYPQKLRSNKIQKRKEELKSQFEQSLHMISAALSSGHSVENALRLTMQDLARLYSGQEVMLLREYRAIMHQLDHGGSIEIAFMDLGQRSGVPEIIQFAEVFLIAKRSGGNLLEIIRDTVFVITGTLRIQQEIEVLIAKKKWEAKALNILPVGIIGLLVYSSPDYMSPLYRGAGVLIMVAACLLLLGCWLISQKIMAIEV